MSHSHFLQLKDQLFSRQASCVGAALRSPINLGGYDNVAPEKVKLLDRVSPVKRVRIRSNVKQDTDSSISEFPFA
jgi:hypothetical protein